MKGVQSPFDSWFFFGGFPFSRVCRGQQAASWHSVERKKQIPSDSPFQKGRDLPPHPVSCSGRLLPLPPGEEEKTPSHFLRATSQIHNTVSIVSMLSPHPDQSPARPPPSAGKSSRSPGHIPESVPEPFCVPSVWG